jgi:hypothetical protein
MNWEAIGALSELVGATAVVVTIGYLTLQVRQQTVAVRSASYQSSTDALNQINIAIATDPELLRVVSSQPASLDELSTEDRYRYSYVLLSLFRVRETIFYQRDEGTTAAQSWTREEITSRKNLESTGVRDWWKTVEYGFAPEFKEYIDGVVAQIDNSIDADGQ